MSIRILKRAGSDWNDPRGVEMFPGNDPLMGNEKLNGQLFRISKRKDRIEIFLILKGNFIVSYKGIILDV